VIRSLGLALAAAAVLAATPALAQSYGGGASSSSSAGAGGSYNGGSRIQQTTGGGPGSGADAKIDTKIDPEAHAQGKKDAPEVIKALGLTCTLTDAYYMGSRDDKDDKGKAVTTKFYEVACQGGVGQIIQFTPPAGSKHYDCFQVLSTPNTRCRLPANADLKAVLATFVTATGRTCAINGFAYKGGTPAGDSYYEVACTGSLGFIIKHTAANENSAFDCVDAQSTNLACKLTTPEQIKAADRGIIDKLLAASGKTCTIADTRSVAKLKGGGAVYEVSCNDKTGYMLEAKGDGSFDHAIPCSGAEGLLGGCTLTDASVPQTQEVATYTKLVKASGFDCAVSKYRYLGSDTNHNEVVEVACSNRPDGGVAVLPADNSPGHVLDCVRAAALQVVCKYSDPALVYPHLSAALAAKGKGTCTVSNARWAVRTTKNTDFIETACSDGLPGWVVEFDTANQVQELYSCGQAASAGVACQLPGNTKK